MDVDIYCEFVGRIIPVRTIHIVPWPYTNSVTSALEAQINASTVWEVAKVWAISMPVWCKYAHSDSLDTPSGPVVEGGNWK
jgi:hypothetical protein